MRAMKITAVLIVDEIETSLPFWIDRLGFQKTLELPEGNRLGFVIQHGGETELMLQTAESVARDIPQFAPTVASRTTLYIEVNDFDATVRRLAGYPIAMSERFAPYGMREIGVFDPAGNVVMLAARS